jgi:hypothetical protein
MDRELRLQITEEGADDERLAQLTGYLRAELVPLDVDNVASPRAGDAPPGSRAGDIAAVGALLVALSQSADSLASVVTAIRSWLKRGDSGVRSVRLEIDGDALELSRASQAEQDRLIELFVNRHSAADGAPWPADAKP